MAYKIIYKKRFSNKLIRLLQYLEDQWGQKTAFEFLNHVDERIETLRAQPFIGKPSEKKPNVRTILITKYNRLYYKLNDDTIIILNMFDTRKNPKRNPYNF